MADQTQWTERHRGLDPSSTTFVPSQRAHHAEWLSSEGRNPDSASFVPRRRHVPTTQPPARSRASRPRRGSAGAAFRAAERAVSTPRVVRTRSDLLAALAANGADAFRVKVHVGGCACERAAAFRETCGDGMLAIPDSRGARAALRVAEAEGDTRHSLEARLKNLLFPDVPVDGVILRVSCAACLLESMPNGAVAFIADSEEEALCKMEPRKARSGEMPSFVVAAPISLLRRAFSPLQGAQRYNKAEEQRGAKQARASLCAFLGDQERAMLTVTADELKADHHLNAFLDNNQARMDQRQQHVPGSRFLVLLASKVQKRWRLELPGGKRRLGESSWDAARRELRDEAGCRLATATLSEVIDFATMRCFIVDSNDAKRASDAAAAAELPIPPTPLTPDENLDLEAILVKRGAALETARADMSAMAPDRARRLLRDDQYGPPIADMSQLELPVEGT